MSSDNGRRWKGRRFRITFADDHEFAGLEVHMRSAPIGLVLAMSEATSQLEGLRDTGSLTEGQSAGFRGLVEQLAQVITWWNVDDDDDQPVKPDVEGLLAQEPMLILTLVEQWAARQTQVAPPLPQGSPDGGSPGASLAMTELSLPMEPLSSSPVS